MTDWTRLADLLPQLALDNDKAGGALSIIHNNKLVLSSAFGQANAHADWTPATLSVSFSIGKGVMASLIAVLVSQGVLDYKAKIADYWSAFAQNGKDAITVLDVLTHRADLFAISSVINDNAWVSDWQTMLDKVAAMPRTAPADPKNIGFVSAYSALVSGWILGGLVEHATNKPLQTVLDDYLARPLGVEGEMFFGLPYALHDNIAVPERLFFDRSARTKPTLTPDSPATRALYASLLLPAWQALGDNINTQMLNKLYFDTHAMQLGNYKDALLADGKTPINYYDKTVLATPIPAANGVFSSRALVTLYAMHANDGVYDDHTFIDANTLQTMRQIYSDGQDAVMPASMQWRAGFHKLFTTQHAPKAYGHMGYNGSVAFCDPERKLAVAFIHNFDTTLLNDVRQFIVSEMVLHLVDNSC